MGTSVAVVVVVVVEVDDVVADDDKFGSPVSIGIWNDNIIAIELVRNENVVRNVVLQN